jgi:hypothetical protein
MSTLDSTWGWIKTDYSKKYSYDDGSTLIYIDIEKQDRRYTYAKMNIESFGEFGIAPIMRGSFVCGKFIGGVTGQCREIKTLPRFVSALDAYFAKQNEENLSGDLRIINIANALKNGKLPIIEKTIPNGRITSYDELLIVIKSQDLPKEYRAAIRELIEC